MMRNADWSQGTYEYLTIIHEIGHALSLAHSRDGHEMMDALDDVRYTIMSYNNYDSQVAQWINGQIVHYAAYTPMVYDIQAAQYLYGANTTTEIGSTTYTFAPATPRVQAIYDSGGIDTFDLTAFTLRNIVDLSPVASSTLGFTHHIDDNTAIAFGSIVEIYARVQGRTIYLGTMLKTPSMEGRSMIFCTVKMAMIHPWVKPITIRYMAAAEMILFPAAQVRII